MFSLGVIFQHGPGSRQTVETVFLLHCVHSSSQVLTEEEAQKKDRWGRTAADDAAAYMSSVGEKGPNYELMNVGTGMLGR